VKIVVSLYKVEYKWQLLCHCLRENISDNFCVTLFSDKQNKEIWLETKAILSEWFVHAYLSTVIKARPFCLLLCELLYCASYETDRQTDRHTPLWSQKLDDHSSIPGNSCCGCRPPSCGGDAGRTVTEHKCTRHSVHQHIMPTFAIHNSAALFSIFPLRCRALVSKGAENSCPGTRIQRCT
jgi:hypothetical protein